MKGSCIRGRGASDVDRCGVLPEGKKKMKLCLQSVTGSKFHSWGRESDSLCSLI